MLYFLIEVITLISILLFFILTRSVLISYYNVLILDTIELLENYINDPKEIEMLIETFPKVLRCHSIDRRVNYHMFLMKRLEELKKGQ